jgi:hypothetical protein|tara:strand:+ start:986 stop:1195 length:210 start_codon:yes stop_codon:yes gene_type:complete
MDIKHIKRIILCTINKSSIVENLSGRLVDGESIIGFLKTRKQFAENQLRLVETILVLVVVVRKIKNVAK